MAEPFKTLISSHAPFATPADLISYRDVRVLGDLVNDDDTRATSVQLATHPVILKALNAASAMIEIAVYRGNRYTRADLQQLQASIADADGTGITVAAEVIRQLTCDIAFWILVKRRKPDVNPRSLTGIPEALATLEGLRLGEALFPFLETVEAEQIDIAPFDDMITKSTYVLSPLSRTGYKFFGVRSRDLRV